MTFINEMFAFHFLLTDRTCALSETVCGLGNMLYKMLKCEDDQMYRSTATQPLSKGKRTTLWGHCLLHIKR